MAELPNTLYFFQYNLVGLSYRVYPVKKSKDALYLKTEVFYDRYGDLGGDEIPYTNTTWPFIVKKNNHRTAYYFADKKQAEMIHKILSDYRNHIKAVI